MLYISMYIYIGIGGYIIRDKEDSSNCKQAPATADKAPATGKRERRNTTNHSPRSTRPTSRPPRQAADVTQAIIVQSFRGGVSPTHTCSRFWAHLRDFARFRELFKIHHLPGLGRLTLVICVIMTRDNARPPLPKPRGMLIFQGFSAAVPFSHLFTLHLCPFQLSTSPLLKNQIQDFTRLSL